MTNRREFLHLGVAALSLPIAARATRQPDVFTNLDSTHAEPIYKAFFDERFPASVAFAREMKRLSVRTRAIRGDITDAWFSDLYHRWKQGPLAIAGLTAPGPIFCLEMLARDAGMRVALRADHRLVAGSRIEHEIAGPANVLKHPENMAAGAKPWPERMAEFVARFPADRDRAAARTNYVEAAVVADGNPEHLVTWIIAAAPRQI